MEKMEQGKYNWLFSSCFLSFKIFFFCEISYLVLHFTYFNNHIHLFLLPGIWLLKYVKWRTTFKDMRSSNNFLAQAYRLSESTFLWDIWSFLFAFYYRNIMYRLLSGVSSLLKKKESKENLKRMEMTLLHIFLSILLKELKIDLYYLSYVLQRSAVY